ncbi:unnamed protein product [Aphanomyces euteiches]|uniref:Uncharacterized protein n=1 Tax=Aphanomyces euteiches TaxID=100861 RepID=A0A6G0X2K1_9STRA|nr:hypothetical protein Ae201684_009231 [Aphanomyces euteiches]KAH9133159.1 hypothetical protein AeRB84_020713 [Aphanomyces euteiches]
MIRAAKVVSTCVVRRSSSLLGAWRQSVDAASFRLMDLPRQSPAFRAFSSQSFEHLIVEDPVDDAKQSIQALCARGDYAAVVESVALWYQPLVNHLQGTQDVAAFQPDKTARVEQEAVALLVQQRAVDAVMILFENIQEMTSASPLVRPTRQTLSFLIGLFHTEKKYDLVVDTYAFAESMSILPTESMNASYLKALVMQNKVQDARSTWLHLCKNNLPRGVYAYREALHLFDKLRDASTVQSILEDMELHGIKMREIDYFRAIHGLSASLRQDGEAPAAEEHAELILDLYNKMQTFESLDPTMPLLFHDVIHASLYLHDDDKAVEVHEALMRLPHDKRNHFVTDALVAALLEREQISLVETLFRSASARDSKQGAAIAKQLMVHFATNGQIQPLFAFLETCPAMKIRFHDDESALKVLRAVASTKDMDDIALWHFLAPRFPQLGLTVNFWWWNMLSIAQDANRWRLATLMVDAKADNAAAMQPQLRSQLMQCGSRILDDPQPDRLACAFVLALVDKVLEKQVDDLALVVRASMLTNDHKKAIAAFKALHKARGSDGELVRSHVAAYKCAQESFRALGFDQQADQIDEILALEDQAKATETPAARRH